MNEKETKRFSLLQVNDSIRDIIFREREWMIDGRTCNWEYFIDPAKQELVLTRF